MALPPDRLDRFARHIVLPEIGGAGQALLAEAHVALVGLGGIGSPALQYLADLMAAPDRAKAVGDVPMHDLRSRLSGSATLT